MKAAIITCNNSVNYGAALQTIALSNHLQLSGAETEVIDYLPPYQGFYTRQWYWPGADIREWAKFVLRFSQRRREIAKHREFVDFKRRFMPVTKESFCNNDSLCADPPKADAYIAGSDQIWNTGFPNGKDPAFYLDFAPVHAKRISYAASFATDTLPDAYADMVSAYLSRFDAVSVREESGREICASLGIPAAVTCDPVLLHDAAFWHKFTDPDVRAPCSQYLLVYDFERSPEVATLARRIARLRKLSIYSVSPWPACYADKNFCSCGPRAFVSLVAGAECVVSNSLHGSVFSLVFRKDFFVIDRHDGLNVRMRDLLNRYGLGRRLVNAEASDADLTANIDYTNVCPRLDADISASKSWLAEALRM